MNVLVVTLFRYCDVTGIDLVHDQAEQSILREIENLRKCQERLTNLHQKVVEQVNTLRKDIDIRLLLVQFSYFNLKG